MTRPYDTLLRTWNDTLLQDEYITDAVAGEILARGWLGQAPATAAELDAAEERLGCVLPSSFRAFLMTTNGWEYPGNGYDFPGRIYAAPELRWFREENQDWIEAFRNPAGAVEISDEQYFVYGPAQDPVHLRTEYLQGCLQISETSEGGVYLLNPAVRQPDGEWEAWWFCAALPGAMRHQSFLELLRYEIGKHR